MTDYPVPLGEQNAQVFCEPVGLVNDSWGTTDTAEHVHRQVGMSRDVRCSLPLFGDSEPERIELVRNPVFGTLNLRGLNS